VRVTTGSAKGRRLLMVPGDSTRPITDRAKQALFSILGGWVEGGRVLDLFGGTGAVGIEALSRGADFAQFVDINRKAVETINANLRNCHLEEFAQVTQGDSFAWLERYHGEPFDLIYIAPPQYQGWWSKALQIVDSRPDLLVEDATVVVQIHPREDTPLELEYLEEFDRRKYGSVMLLFYASAEELAMVREEILEESYDGDEDDGYEADEMPDILPEYRGEMQSTIQRAMNLLFGSGVSVDDFHPQVEGESVASIRRKRGLDPQ
jgi:16S rRNA (guanine966-N2)-methyltransferase